MHERLGDMAEDDDTSTTYSLTIKSSATTTAISANEPEVSHSLTIKSSATRAISANEHEVSHSLTSKSSATTAISANEPEVSHSLTIKSSATTAISANEPEVSHSYLVPKDKAAWMEYSKGLAKSRTKIVYLQEDNLENIITLSKKVVCAKKKYNYEKDPSLHGWYYWSKEQLSAWLVKCGLSNLKEMFLMNNIDGRKLGMIDASALQKMGVKYLEDVNNAMTKIRKLQGFRYPNSMRAHSRRLPYEEFLKFNWKRGETYDLYTYQDFCLEMGYSFDEGIKPALIPCTCPVSVSVRNADNLHVASDDSFGSKNSLDFAPTVEFVVRAAIVRDKLIHTLLNELLKAAFPNPVEIQEDEEEIEEEEGEEDEKEKGEEDLTSLTLQHSLHCKLAEAYEELGIENTELCALEQLNFASSVAKEFLNEILKTKDVLENIEALQKNVDEDETEDTVHPEVLSEFVNATKDILERIAPTAALLALMKLDLDLLVLTKEVYKIEKSMHERPYEICLDFFGENEE